VKAKELQLKITLIYNFALPALLLNCLGIVILNLINSYHVSMNSASWLEAFKDISIFAGSFFLASYIPRLGYKRSLLIGILLEIIASLLMAIFPSVMMARIFFVCVGVAFALIKVAIYSSVGLITKTDSEHASFLSILEGFFMAGVLSGFWIFGFFMSYSSWLGVFWLTAGLSFLGLLLALFSSIDESKVAESADTEAKKHDIYRGMFKLLTQMVVWFFLALAFCYLFIEQGAINWLPTFNNHVLDISSANSVEIASILSASLALGRLIFGYVMKFIHWTKVVTLCMAGAFVVLFIALYLAYQLPHPTHVLTHWSQYPFAAYLLPLVGFLIAPIYPTLCSSILSKQPLYLHSAMTIWIIIFSALGATVGSRILGLAFGSFGGLMAMGILLIPIAILTVFTFPYYWQLKKHVKAE